MANLALGMLAALAYVNTLAHGLVWDDPISLQRWLPALPTWGDAFFPPSGIPQFPSEYYRPLQLLSYRLDRFIGGGAPWAFHLSVVLLHVLATVLVYRAGLQLFARTIGGGWAALWAAALFAVHPIHSESVAWMAARPDVMVTCAGLAALLAYWHTPWIEWQRSLVAAAFILTGLLCKENAAALLIMVPASLWLLGARRATSGPAATPLTYLPFLAAALVYLGLRRAGLHAALPVATMPADVLPMLVAAVGTYLRLLILPYPQNAYVTDLPTDMMAVASNALVILCFVALFWWAWRRKQRPLVFSLAWMVVTLAPSLTLVARSSTAPFAERYLYLPSVGFCWIAGDLLARVEGHGLRRRARVAISLLLVAALTLTVARNRVWRDNLSLWSDAAAKNRTDGLPLRSLAAATLDAGDAASAERLFHEALKRRNNARGEYTIYNNLGTMALNRNDDVVAEQHYRKALELQPSADTMFNLGLIALRRGMSSELTPDGATRTAKTREARRFFEQALEASPYDPDIHVALGQAAHALGDDKTARQHLEQALSLGLAPATEAGVRRVIAELK